MATDIAMPRLSDSMEEGTILKWLVSEGDEVKRGQEIVEIETDKANMTYESDSEGVVVELVAHEGDTLPLGEVIARLGEPGEAPSADGAGGRDKAGGEAEAGGEQAEAEGERAEGDGEEAESEPEERAEQEAGADAAGEEEGEKRAATATVERAE